MHVLFLDFAILDAPAPTISREIITGRQSRCTNPISVTRRTAVCFEESLSTRDATIAQWHLAIEFPEDETTLP
jgi:hypothetical protein